MVRAKRPAHHMRASINHFGMRVKTKLYANSSYLGKRQQDDDFYGALEIKFSTHHDKIRQWCSQRFAYANEENDQFSEPAKKSNNSMKGKKAD